MPSPIPSNGLPRSRRVLLLIDFIPEMRHPPVGDGAQEQRQENAHLRAGALLVSKVGCLALPWLQRRAWRARRPPRARERP
jgi:hypothetical protein